jgi:parallel beta-helix repeat protein
MREQEMKRGKLAATFLAVAMAIALAVPAGAVDGTIEINQAKVLAAGGFPYVISATGSYRLTGNLTVPAATNGINFFAANATLDLNGFSISGPGSTSDTPIGVNAAGIESTVENGTITGFGFGVKVGFYGIVRNMHADENGDGILAGSDSIVENCTANSSTQTTIGSGIVCISGCRISGNTANGNVSGGIVCTGSACVISGNALFNNSVGISASDGTTGYGQNVLKNTTDHNGGTSLGNNLCSGTIC